MLATAEDRIKAELYAAALTVVRQKERAGSIVKHDYQTPPPGDWSIWAIIAGRGAGKTFAGAEFIMDQVAAGARRVALVGATGADVRDVMIEGPSGIITRAIEHGWRRPTYQPSRRRVVIYPPDREPALAFIYSAEEPARLRGPEHEAAWCDELSSWKYEDAWNNLQFGMRIGAHPRTIVTTTPKPVPLVRKLMKRANDTDTVAITRGRTKDNERNLSPVFLQEVTNMYAGTRLGRQELDGELLEDVEGALWTIANLDQHRILTGIPEGVTLKVVVIGVDPAATSNQDSDETGIVACAAGSDRRGYVLADLSLIGAPLQWASKAVSAYHAHEANFIVVETNNGGEMVTQTIKTVDPKVPVRDVHASRGKQTRAEPISALYEQGWISHVGSFPQLEDQMTQWVPGLKSPDRMDALVWACTALLPYIGVQRIGGLI